MTKIPTIKNPKTGRRIIVNGPTYQKLMRDGYHLTKQDIRYHKKPSRQYQDKLDTDTQSQHRMKVGYYLKKKDRKGRGIMTRGWGKVAPKKGRERTELYEKCGKRCFLKADTLSFPICPKNKCEIDCRGLTAAYIRARQWKYNNIGNKAKQLRRLKCNYKT